MSRTADRRADKAASNLLADIDRTGVLTDPAGMTDADIDRLTRSGQAVRTAVADAGGDLTDIITRARR